YEFRPALPGFPESELDPFAALSEAVSGRRGKIDRTSASGCLTPTRPCGRFPSEPTDARSDRNDSLSVKESQVMTRRGSIRAVEADADHAGAVDGNSKPRRVLAGRDHPVRGRTRRGRYRETRLRIRRFDVRGPVEIERFDESGHVLRRLGEGHDACREERVTVEDRDLPQGVGAVEGRPDSHGKPPDSEERAAPRDPALSRGGWRFPSPGSDSRCRGRGIGVSVRRRARGYDSR